MTLHPSGLLTFAEAALYLRMSASTLRRLAGSEIPVIRRARYVRFERADLDEWKAATKTTKRAGQPAVIPCPSPSSNEEERGLQLAKDLDLG